MAPEDDSSGPYSFFWDRFPKSWVWADMPNTWPQIGSHCFLYSIARQRGNNAFGMLFERLEAILPAHFLHSRLFRNSGHSSFSFECSLTGGAPKS
jgi:hypothetical protein